VAALLVCTSLLPFMVGSAHAQYMYLDANRNGVHDAGDRLCQSGIDSIDIWIDTGANRDGSPTECVTGHTTLAFNSYEFTLQTVNGTVAWGTYTNAMTGMTLRLVSPPGVCSDSYHDGFIGITANVQGRYRLGTLEVTVTSGTPSIEIVSTADCGRGATTSFGTICQADDEYSHTYVLGRQWHDTDGVGPPLPGVHPPTVTAPASVIAYEGAGISMTATASDADAGDTLTILESGMPQSLSFVSTPRPSPATATISGVLGHLDAGTYNILWTVNDGTCGPATTVTTELTVLSADLAADPLDPRTTRASVTSDGSQVNQPSLNASISADGNFVAFQSAAPDLVSGDTNGLTDVFVHDLRTGATDRISVDSAGNQGNGPSYAPSISSDGRYVAFLSDASNLVSGDTNGATDCFLHDRLTGITELVSLTTSGSESNGPSQSCSVSADGGRVAFCSVATNLVPGDANLAADVFVRDRVAWTTTRVSVTTGGGEANGPSCLNSASAISADGNDVVFESTASNLVANDTNGQGDVFLRDLDSGTTELVSVASGGGAGNGASQWPAISGDGRYVAFSSLASDLIAGDLNGTWDVFVRDRTGARTERVSVGVGGQEADGNSGDPAISSDGRYVGFFSQATNLVSDDTNGYGDLFVHDRTLARTERISVDTPGFQVPGPDQNVGPSSMSASGRRVAFQHVSAGLVGDDTNGLSDVFVRDRGAIGDGVPDLVAYWRLNGTGGETVETSTLFPTGSVTFPAGKLNAAANLLGGWFDSPALPSYSLAWTGLTAECWARLNSFQGGTVLLRAGSPTTANETMWMLSTVNVGNPDAHVGFAVKDSGVVVLSVISHTPITDGQWHHVAVAYGHGRTDLYIDGIADTTVIDTVQADVTGGLVTLGAGLGGSGALNGQVDEVRIWDVERTSSQIQAGMNGEILAPTGVTRGPSPVPSVRLYQNAPNPFNPSTRIRYELSRAGPARLRVYDVRGRLVATLVDEVLQAGPHSVTWLGRDGSGRVAASGVYFYKLEAEGASLSMKMVLLK
jgi:Tol biopolymer transport system component